MVDIIIVDTFAPGVVHEIDYAAMPERELAWRARGGDSAAATELDDMKIASVFHLPGKHNQKTHGRHGSGTWKPVDTAKVEANNYKMLKKMAGNNVSDEVLRELATLPPGTRIYELDGGKVELTVPGGVELNDADLEHTQNVLTDLHDKYPIRGNVGVGIGTPDAFNPTVVGETMPDLRAVRINNVAYQPDFKYFDGDNHPAAMYRDPAGATIAHEWGHLVGKDEEPVVLDIMYTGNYYGLSGYARAARKPVEGYADCFADFYMGDNSLGATSAYAERFGWKEQA